MIMKFQLKSIVLTCVCTIWCFSKTTAGYSMEANRAGLVLFRPRVDQFHSMARADQQSTTTTATPPPENTLSELLELIDTKTDVPDATTDDVGELSAEGRGQKKKHHHKRRMMYPVMIGLLIAKAIIFPMLLKALTIMSSASFVLSSMSLLTSVLLGFKWFLTSSQHQAPQVMRMPEAQKVEIVHVPVKKFNDWDRETEHHHSSGPVVLNDNYDSYYSNDHDQALKPTSYTR